jgi:hypothetical protein
MNPLEKFNLILQGNYVNPGFRQPSDSQMPMQNLFNTQQFSQDVANDKAQQDLIAKQQQDFRKANMLIALGDALKGKDIGQGLMQRQQLFQQQEEKRQAKLQEQQLQQKLKGYYENLPEGSLKNFAKLMLDAPGGYKNLPAVFNLQYQQEQEKQEKDQYSASIDSAMREGLIDQTYGNQLKELPMELGYKLYSQSIFGGAEEKTANQRDLAAWNQAKADFDAGKISQEEFDAATEILGADSGLSKEQQIINLATKLYAAKDVVGEPMYKENEIQERLKQFANTYDAYFAIDLGPQD